MTMLTASLVVSLCVLLAGVLILKRQRGALNITFIRYPADYRGYLNELLITDQRGSPECER